MFKSRKKIVINNLNQLRVLEANPVAGAPVLVLGEGTSQDDFDAWTATNFVQIFPVAAQFKLADLRVIRKTVVAGSSAVLADVNFATPVLGSQDSPAANRIAVSTTARRESGQTSTLTINAVPAVGSQCVVTIWQRDSARNYIETQLGEKRFSIQATVKATHTTPALFAAYLTTKIQETLSNLKGENKFFTMGVSVAGAVITLTSKTGFDFKVYTEGSTFAPDVVDINSTFATTIPAFYGINNYNYMRRHVQNVDGVYSYVTGETDFFPVDGVYYTSYHIEYENSTIDEHQQSSVDVVQTHRHEVEIYVNPALTTLITKLDLIGGF